MPYRNYELEHNQKTVSTLSELLFKFESVYKEANCFNWEKERLIDNNIRRLRDILNRQLEEVTQLNQ